MYLPFHKRILLCAALASTSLSGADYAFSDNTQFEDVFEVSSEAAHPVAAWSNAPGQDRVAGRINLAALPASPLTLGTKAPIPSGNCTISIDFLGKEYVKTLSSNFQVFIHPKNSEPDSPLFSLGKDNTVEGAVLQASGGLPVEGIHLDGSAWYRVSLTIIQQNTTDHSFDVSITNLDTGILVGSASGSASLPSQENVLSIVLDTHGGGALALDNLSLHHTSSIDFALLDEDSRLVYALAEEYTVNEDGSLSTEGDLSYLPRTESTNNENRIGISFTPRRNELSYSVEFSTDLLNWTPMDMPAISADERITIESPLPVSETPRQFLRLKITQP